MAYDINIYGAFSGRPAYQLHLYVRHNAYSGNSQQFAWQLLAERVGAGTAYALNPQPWGVNINGEEFGGATPLDFRSTNSISMGAGVTSFIPHDGNGNLTINCIATIDARASGDPFGIASGAGLFTTDRIAQGPGAPVPGAISQIAPTSMVYSFNGAGTPDGGSAINAWSFQIATNSEFTAGVVTTGAQQAWAYTFGGLDPARQYWIRHRAHNAVGAGPWSGAATATTLSGVFVAWNGSWRACGVFVGQGGQWVPAGVYVGKGDQWVVAS